MMSPAAMSPALRRFLTGVGAGATQGAAGIGGGVVLTATLSRQMPQVQAVASSLPCLVPANAMAATTFASAGACDPVASMSMGAASIVGAMAGARLGGRLDEVTYRGVFGGVFFLLGGVLMVSSRMKCADDCERPSAQGQAKEQEGQVVSRGTWTEAWRPSQLLDAARARGAPAVVELLGVGAAVGMLSGSMGVGATPIMTLYMVLRCDADQRTAIGTSIAAVVPNIITGSLTHAMAGATQWRALPLLAAGAAVGGVIGSSIALYLPNELLQDVFAIFVSVLGLRTLQAAWRAKAAAATKK